MKTLRTMKRMLVALLSASMLLTSSALAAGPVEDPAVDEAPERETEYLFISQTDAASETLEFQLSEEGLAAVSADGADITWTLERIATYANPADGEFYPLHDEDVMYPNEQYEIDLENIRNESG